MLALGGSYIQDNWFKEHFAHAYDS